MVLLVGGIIMLVISNVLGYHMSNAGQEEAGSKLPDNYKDVFVAGVSGKKTLGTTSSTCWARGGICVDIKECPSLKFDVSVAGCAWGYKVCCKVHQFTSPTVGVLRRYNLPVIHDLNELGASLEIIALRNSMMLSNWQTAQVEDEDIRLDDLMN